MMGRWSCDLLLLSCDVPTRAKHAGCKLFGTVSTGIPLHLSEGQTCGNVPVICMFLALFDERFYYKQTKRHVGG